MRSLGEALVWICLVVKESKKSAPKESVITGWLSQLVVGSGKE